MTADQFLGVGLAFLWQDAAATDLDARGMSAWLQFAINIVYLLIGAVLGAGVNKNFEMRRASKLRDSLNEVERASLAKHLMRRGDTTEAHLMASVTLEPELEEHHGLLADLNLVERQRVAERLARGSRMGTSSPRAARRQVPGTTSLAASKTDRAALAACEALVRSIRAAAVALSTWTKSPVEEWLHGIESEQGPLQALAKAKEALISASSQPPQANSMCLAETVVLAAACLRSIERVLRDTREVLSRDSSPLEIRKQVANTTEFVLRELPAALAELNQLGTGIQVPTA